MQKDGFGALGLSAASSKRIRCDLATRLRRTSGGKKSEREPLQFVVAQRGNSFEMLGANNNPLASAVIVAALLLTTAKTRKART